MAYNIGLNVIEVDGSASPAIVGAGDFIALDVPKRPSALVLFGDAIAAPRAASARAAASLSLMVSKEKRSASTAS